MSEETYRELVEQNLSTYKIGEILGIGQSTVRYYLRKFGLHTKNFHHSKEFKDCKNGYRCFKCDVELTGAKRKFCSKKCRGKTHAVNTNERQTKVGIDRKLTLIRMAGGGCNICGYNKNYAALQFHHKDPENKMFTLDMRKLSNTKWQSILKEFEKCDLLCANCHIELHYPDKELVVRVGVEPTLPRL